MSDQTITAAEFAADLLRGADPIAAYLREIGFEDATAQKVYYWHQTKRISLGKFGNELITTKTKLLREARKLVA